MKKSHSTILAASAAVLALVGTAVGASYVTRESLSTPPAEIAPVRQAEAVRHKPIHHGEYAAGQTARRPVTQQAQATQPPCDDHNVVGTVGGALAGGVVGHQFGKGTGRTLATVGGAAGGAYLGNEYIPTRGVACK